MEAAASQGTRTIPGLAQFPHDSPHPAYTSIKTTHAHQQKNKMMRPSSSIQEFPDTAKKAVKNSPNSEGADCMMNTLLLERVRLLAGTEAAMTEETTSTVRGAHPPQKAL